MVAIAAVCVSLEAHADVCLPRFVHAVPVRTEGCMVERNAFFTFRVSFDAAEGERPVMRIAGCSAYRIFLSGCHAGRIDFDGDSGWR